MKHLLFIILIVITNYMFGQIPDTLLNINPNNPDNEVFFKTTYWDSYEIGEGSAISEWNAGIDMKLNYFADTPFKLRKVKETFISDSISGHCWCGWDFEIFVVKMDTIFSTDKYVFCCNEVFNGHIVDSLKVAGLISQLDTVKIGKYHFDNLFIARETYLDFKTNSDFISIFNKEPVWMRFDGAMTISLIIPDDILENNRRINRFLEQEFKKVPYEAIEKRYYKGYPDTNEVEYRIKIALDKDGTARLGKNIKIIEPWDEFKDININFKWKKLPNR